MNSNASAARSIAVAATICLLACTVALLWVRVDAISEVTESGAEPYLPYAELSVETPVAGVWRDTAGNVIGTYDTDLGSLNNVSQELLELQNFKAEVSTLLHECLTDPEKRAIFLRHDFTEAQLDLLAKRFEDELGLTESAAQ